MFENVSKWPKAFPQRPLERLVKPVGDLQWDFSRNQPVALHTLIVGYPALRVDLDGNQGFQVSELVSALFMS